MAILEKSQKQSAGIYVRASYVGRFWQARDVSSLGIPIYEPRVTFARIYKLEARSFLK